MSVKNTFEDSVTRDTAKAPAHSPLTANYPPSKAILLQAQLRNQAALDEMYAYYGSDLS